MASPWKLTSAWSSPPTPYCCIKLPAPIPAFPCCEIFNPAYLTGPSFFCKGSSYKGHCGPDGLVKMTQLYLHSVKSTHRQYLNKQACLCPIKFYLQNRQWARFGLSFPVTIGFGGNVKLCSHLEICLGIPQLNTELTYDPAILLLGMYPRNIKTYVHSKTWTWIFIATIFIISQKCN